MRVDYVHIYINNEGTFDGTDIIVKKMKAKTIMQFNIDATIKINILGGA